MYDNAIVESCKFSDTTTAIIAIYMWAGFACREYTFENCTTGVIASISDDTTIEQIRLHVGRSHHRSRQIFIFL